MCLSIGSPCGSSQSDRATYLPTAENRSLLAFSEPSVSSIFNAAASMMILAFNVARADGHQTPAVRVAALKPRMRAAS